MMWGVLAIVSVSLGGFLLGYRFTGSWRRPKHSRFAVVLNFRRTKYHIHHWMHCLPSVGFIILMGLNGAVSLEATAVKYGAAFVSGYGIQGLFCKDAFKVRNYDRFAQKH
ncbi:MAG: hypothetical protein ABIH41_07375 [Nanoarchaeota archaeon]